MPEDTAGRNCWSRPLTEIPNNTFWDITRYWRNPLKNAKKIYIFSVGILGRIDERILGKKS